MNGSQLTEREERILEAVIRTYVETAEPAGSRTVARRFGLGVSPATVRNAMSDLEERGYLFHPHTSAGRIPTDLAYRYYVDTLMRPHRLTAAQQRRVRRELAEGEGGALEQLIRSATQVLGLVTGELGLALSPRLEDVTLEKIELVRLSSERVLLVLTLGSGSVRTVYVNLPTSVPAEALSSLTVVLNERLAGLPLTEIRSSVGERLRDGGTDESSTELLNIFLQSADEWLGPLQRGDDEVVLGRASVLAGQPEFASGAGLRDLLELTERRDLLARVLTGRAHEEMPTITIGTEHGHPRLSTFTLVTSEYRFGHLTGVIGVMGPTRMPYEKVATIVEYTSLLVGELAGGSDAAQSEAAG
jgi:heat-inducible transcriptional repressor